MIPAENNLGIVVIAAGNSSRLGQAKQLVKYKDVSLLENTLNLATRLGNQVICVLGYDAVNIKSKVKTTSLSSTTEFIINHHWHQGIGSSIASGVNRLTERQENSVDAIMILLCDQYLLTHGDLNKLTAHWLNNPGKKSLVASQYFDQQQNESVVGVPAIFSKHYFSSLCRLKEKGAKILLRDNPYLTTVLIESAAFDLDTLEDLQQLNKEQNSD